jgi:hypothetical protein
MPADREFETVWISNMIHQFLRAKSVNITCHDYPAYKIQNQISCLFNHKQYKLNYTLQATQDHSQFFDRPTKKLINYIPKEAVT